ncbi:cysteine-rich CWC family protein [Undibacterium griseum]|uniref:Cysteine-rich CWC family protein n=1 Tax=Undibacterium griseum TaxID=2762295 RepID=A0ABR6YPG9_9BURK|nr:cysteine-rich CWC family protein [Undibacterium griseum]MBC3885770.1 cysteine-rich CWC family protein [Undibacterium griseum]
MSRCPRCQAEFLCAMADQTGKPCWCTALPPVDFSLLPEGKLNMDASCFCPACLPAWKASLEAGRNKPE